MAWAWWLGAALLLAVVEMLSLDLVLIMFAGGALAAAGLAAAGADLWLQILGFVVVSVLLLLALRPWLLRHLRTRVPLVETNAAALVGRIGVAVSQVSERDGRIKLEGDVWTARTQDDEVVSVGDEVRVLRIAGATAVVTAHHDHHHRPHPAGPSDRPQETAP